MTRAEPTPTDLGQKYGLGGEVLHVRIGQSLHALRAGQPRTLCGRRPAEAAGTLMSTFGTPAHGTTDGSVTCSTCFGIITAAQARSQAEPPARGADAWMQAQRDGAAPEDVQLVVDL